MPSRITPLQKKRLKFLLGTLVAGCAVAAKVLAGSITLAWDPSPSPEVVGYRLYYGPASGVYTNSAAAGNVTNATLSVPSGVTLYYAATAYDADGVESVFSNEATNTIPLVAPSAPTHLGIRPAP